MIDEEKNVLTTILKDNIKEYVKKDNKNNIFIDIKGLINILDSFIEKNRFSCTPYSYPVIKDTFCWPSNIILELGIRYLSDEDLILMENGINYCLNNFLTEREKDILLKYYKENLTLKEIAIKYDLTTERIRQIIRKSMRKLSVPYRLDIIKYGYEYINKCKELMNEEKIKYEEKVKQIANKTELLDKMIQTDEIKKDIKEILTPIEELNLSVRSYNCLHMRTKYKYIEEMQNITSGDLMKIRNLGRKSYNEIVNKLLEYRIDVKFNDKKENA